MTKLEENEALDSLFDDIPEATDTGLDHVSSVVTDRDLEIHSEHNYFIEGFSSAQIIEAKEYSKFIKASEKIVRQSFEYAQYLGWLKSLEVGIASCSVMSNVTAEDATIEMHHYPFSLYDLCEIVASRQFSQVDRITTFSVADEVLKCHFENLIGLVPLSETMHNLVHSGKIFINLKQVFGKVIDFIEKYNEFISVEQKEKFVVLLKFSQANIPIADENFLTMQDTPDDITPPISAGTLRLISSTDQPAV